MTRLELGTAYTWASARTRGATRGQIAQDGVRLGRGVYLSSAVDPDLVARCRAWALVLPADAAFGLGTAAALCEAPVGSARTTSVVVPSRGRLPRRAGLTVHERLLTPEDVVVNPAGLRLTSGPQTFLDLAARLPDAELVAVGDALVRAGHMTADALARRLERAGRVRGVVRARDCASLLDPRAASRPESLVRYWLVSSDLPDPEVQVPVHDRWGREVTHADLGYPEWRIALEYEGRPARRPRAVRAGHRPVLPHGGRRVARRPVRRSAPDRPGGRRGADAASPGPPRLASLICPGQALIMGLLQATRSNTPYGPTTTP
ncbi:hypothetical protein ACI79C_05495 [Geodermatophilus sp. SYSU D00697]